MYLAPCRRLPCGRRTDRLAFEGNPKMGRNVRAVFFDAGYTLLCMEPEQRTNFLQSCDDLGISIDRSRLDEAVSRANLLLAPRAPGAVPMPYSKQAIDEFWIEYNRIVLNTCAYQPRAIENAEALYRRFMERLQWRVYDEVRPLLADLRARGILLGVVSNWTGDLEDVLDAVELRRPFNFVLDSAIFGHEKPHAEIFREAIRLAGVAVHHALHVGDSPEHDVEGALSFGMQAALLDRDDRFPDFDRAPRLRRLDDLLALLD